MKKISGPLTGSAATPAGLQKSDSNQLVGQAILDPWNMFGHEGNIPLLNPNQ
jgi:hypothetical protein